MMKENMVDVIAKSRQHEKKDQIPKPYAVTMLLFGLKIFFFVKMPRSWVSQMTPNREMTVN